MARARRRRTPRTPAARTIARLRQDRDRWRRKFHELAAICQGYDDCRERCGPRRRSCC